EDVSHLSFEDRRISVDCGSHAKFGRILPNHIPVTKCTHCLEPFTSVIDSIEHPARRSFQRKKQVRQTLESDAGIAIILGDTHEQFALCRPRLDPLETQPKC